MKAKQSSMRTGGMGHEPKALYRHEEEEPKMPMRGSQEAGMGCCDFKEEAHPIAYGQAGSQYMEDNKKIDSQMKHYHWEGSSEY